MAVFTGRWLGSGTAGSTQIDERADVGQSDEHGRSAKCAQSAATEQACSLDAFPGAGLTDGNGAENPQVTAGTLVPGKPTTPWITWDESSTNGGQHSVFVARLDPAGDHFDLLNNGQPISHSGLDSTRPDIAFAGNTPYVSWHETDAAGNTLTFVGHFEGSPADPVFHIDTPQGIPSTPQGSSDDDTTDVRSPIASTCPDDPFTADGQSCTGGAVGTPFYAFTDDASGPRQLFAQGYTPGTTTTEAASAVTDTTASVAGAVSTDGALERLLDPPTMGPPRLTARVRPTCCWRPQQVSPPRLARRSGAYPLEPYRLPRRRPHRLRHRGRSGSVVHNRRIARHGEADLGHGARPPRRRGTEAGVPRQRPRTL